LKIYWTSLEFNLKPKNKDFGKFKGGFVYLFVKETEKINALKRFKTELDKLNLNPINIEFVKPYENVEWENKKEEKHFETIIAETENCSEVIFDDFYMYE
jgi:hypothetical protein